MQSPKWRLLNVLADLATDKQLQSQCSNGQTVIQVFANIIELALWKPYKGPDYMDENLPEESAMT